MSCDEIFELLPEYVGGGLSKELRGKVAFHLASCEECRLETALLLKQKRPAELPESVRNTAFELVKSDQKCDDSLSAALDTLSDTIRTTRAALRLASTII